jgi:hypothetical protein
VVFATAAPSWRVVTGERIATVFGDSEITVRLLEAV